MYGLILLVLKDLVVKKCGEEKWRQVSALAKTSADFEEAKPYEDVWLYKIAGAASKLLDIPLAELVESAGYYFVEYILKTEHGKILTHVGRTLPEILKNINSMHGHLKISRLHQMQPPTFRCTNEKPNSLRLHYMPGNASRVSLAPLVIGIIKGLAEVHLKLDRLTIKQKRFNDKGDDHDEFVVRWALPKEASNMDDGSLSSTSENTLKHGLTKTALDEVFPFHFSFNKKLEIVQMGKSLAKIVTAETGDPISQFFTLERPSAATLTSWSTLYKYHKIDYFIFVHKYDQATDFVLKGQMVYVSKEGVLCFVGSPVLKTLDEAAYFGLSMSDFAMHDTLTSMLFMPTKPSSQDSEGDTSDERTENVPPAPPPPVASVTNGTTGLSYSSEKKEKRHTLKTWFGSKLTPEVEVKKKKEKARAKEQDWTRWASVSHGQVPILHSRGGGPLEDDSVLSLPCSAPTSARTARDQLNSSWESQRNFHSFTELLMEDGWHGYPLMRALLSRLMNESSCQVNRVFSAAVRIHKNAGKLSTFMEALFSHDLARSNKETLLRSDAPSIKALHAYVEQEAPLYIRSLVERMAECLESVKKKNLEIDPSRLSDKNMSETNAKILLNIAERWLKTLCESSNNCPPGLRKLLRRISEEVAFAHPEMSVSAIANILFFRFIGPALLTPKLGEERDITTQRALTVVFKVVQALVNKVQFTDAQDSYMKPFNSFVSTENQQLLQTFVMDLIDEAKIVETEHQQTVERSKEDEDFVVRASMAIIRDALLQNMEFLWKASISDPQLGTLLQRFLSVGLCSIRF
ncbi:Heme NO binding associated [Balamuthia mandrillaris]